MYRNPTYSDPYPKGPSIPIQSMFSKPLLRIMIPSMADFLRHDLERYCFRCGTPQPILSEPIKNRSHILGSCQNYGPFLVPYYNTAPSI